MGLLQRLAGDRLHLRGGLVARERRAPLEDVDQSRLSGGWRVPHDEVSRQADPLDRHAEAAPQFHVENRERDRQPLAVVDDAAHMAVGAVVVLRPAPVETVLREQVAVDRLASRNLVRVGGKRAADVLGHPIDAGDVVLDIELVVVEPRHLQCRAQEIGTLPLLHRGHDRRDDGCRVHIGRHEPELTDPRLEVVRTLPQHGRDRLRLGRQHRHVRLRQAGERRQTVEGGLETRLGIGSGPPLRERGGDAEAAELGLGVTKLRDPHASRWKPGVGHDGDDIAVARTDESSLLHTDRQGVPVTRPIPGRRQLPENGPVVHRGALEAGHTQPAARRIEAVVTVGSVGVKHQTGGAPLVVEPNLDGRLVGKTRRFRDREAE